MQANLIIKINNKFKIIKFIKDIFKINNKMLLNKIINNNFKILQFSNIRINLNIFKSDQYLLIFYILSV